MKRIFFHFLVFSNLLAVGWVLYQLAWYAFDYQNKLRAEHIIGAIYVAYFSAPLWLWLFLSAIFRRKKLTRKEVVVALRSAFLLPDF